MKIPFFSCLNLSKSRLLPKQIYILFTFLIQISYFSCISGQCLEDQRALLLQLKNTLTYNSSLSAKLVYWNQITDCCNWNGVECDNFGHIIGLELDNETISAGIGKTSALYSFRYLENLNLAYNDFSYSQIPRELGNLTNLAHLNLSYARFDGRIPVELSKMTSLVTLDLSSDSQANRLEYPNLNNLIQNLTRLEELYLDFVDFTQKEGWWEALSLTLPNLQSLSLSYCGLSVRLNSSFLQLRTLSVLGLSGNDLSNTSLDFVANLRNLTVLSMRDCSLEGALPAWIFQVLNLQYLDLSKNSLTGNIPTSLFSLPSLQSLWLSYNNFSGQVNEFSTLNSNLEELRLHENQLEGLIPKSFFRLTNLIELTLSFNLFNGTIQLENFQTLQNLEFVDLSDNRLSVSLSNDNSFQGQLSYLYLASCNLSSFPNLRNQIEIVLLDLSSNKISGNIPNWIWEIGNGSLQLLDLSNNFLTNLQTPYQIPSSLQILDLHSNMLHGELPVFEGSLFSVDYSNNNFQGHIPFDIGISISDARFFSVANNSLAGEIPISLCNATFIELIDLSDNLLGGGLPPCLVQNLTFLRVLKIARNNISGNIPDTFPINCSLGTLDLSRNNLRGNIPPSMANCKSLQVLNVAINNFNGAFPCILMNLSSLRILVLRSNKFFGDIRCHGFVHSWSNLQIIDMAFNNFNGFVDPGFISSLTGMKHKNNPRSTGNSLGLPDGGIIYYTVTIILKGRELEFVNILTTLTSIDFSNNKFRGAIPEAFGELSSLHTLNLSHNLFTSRIPKALGNSTNLESLDLSGNQLTGDIPTELTSLTFLSFFNVSYNELVGRIPSGNQFGTFSAASYEGNLGLCGSPVNQSCGSYIIPAETSTTSRGKKDVDWLFMLVGLGYATGVALIVLPPLFSRRWGDRLEELQVKLLKLIWSGYRS